MATRKLKNGGRRKAPFGSQEAAILASAAINAATQLTAAGINASATKDAAQKQAQAINSQAMKQADALREQNLKANEMQTKSQEFINEQNAENRELQKDIQMQLQMLAGTQNVNNRLEASKIQVKNGGSTRRKLRLAGNSQFLLRGSNNMPFVVTDGGSVIPIGQTPEGYDMYEILGNDHEHYHKAKGGKNKTGVGIKFADGNVIEGEGNQNTNQGEIMVNTPDNAYFISKHSIAGFNPAKMTLGGMHPLRAYAIQEQLKAANGISDDGKHNSTPVEKMLLGGQPNPLITMYNQVGPQPGVDTSGDTAVGVVAEVQKDKRKLRNGGRCRTKAKWGTDAYGNPIWINDDILTIEPARGYAGPLSYENQPVITTPRTTTSTKPTTTTTTTTTTPTRSGFDWGGFSSELGGGLITAGGNIGGALITSKANRDAAGYLSDAYNAASGYMRDAYNSLTGVSMDSIDRKNFAAAHVMPALQAPVSFVNSKNALVNRTLHRNLANAGKYSASSAAAYKRMSNAEIAAQDARNQNYAEDQQMLQQIRQENANRITQAALKNAELDVAANRDYTAAYMDLLQYNNDINNQKILGAAGASAEGVLNSANAWSNARTANANAWASALTASSQGFANGLNAMATRKAELEAALLGAGSDTRAAYYAQVGTRSQALRQYNALKVQRDAALSSGDTEGAKRIARQMNTIAARRGFELV